METPQRYADIFHDSTFKYILGEDGKESMISLLRTFLNIPDIADIEYIKTENVGVGQDDINTHYDIACMTSSGERFIVEAQVAEQRYFGDRSLLYVSEMVHSAASASRKKWKETHGRGRNYRFSPIYLLSLFKGRDGLDHASDDCIHTYRMLDVKTKEDLGSDVTVTFVELGKYKWDPERKGTLDQWLYTLKNIRGMSEMPGWITDDGLKSLYQKADIRQLPELIRNKYLESMTTENDWLNAIDFAEEKAEARGLAKGLVEGEAIGVAKGEAIGVAKQSRTIAKMMKEAGEPAARISLYTGLSEEEISRL